MYSKDEVIDAINKCLTGEEREIIKSRFGIDTGIPVTIQEIILKFDITREELRNIERKVLSYLKIR